MTERSFLALFVDVPLFQAFGSNLDVSYETMGVEYI